MDRGIFVKKELAGILSLVLCLALLFSAAAPAAAQDAKGGCDSCGNYSIMHPDQETLEKWIEAYNNAPRAYIKREGVQAPSPGGSLDLLDYLQYTPDERDQGKCNNCWAWAGTGVMEIALDAQEGIKDRLSVQYINSCEKGVINKTCCYGGWLYELADFYDATHMAIPWSNTNAQWQDGDVSCDTSCGSISTDPNYPITAIEATTIVTQTVDQATAIANIKNVLNQGKGVWFAFFVPNSDAWGTFTTFWNTSSESAVYNIDQFCGTNYTDGGGHAVLCVGYNDDDPNNRYWIMLNSWGTTANGKRPNGLFRINMDMAYNCILPGLSTVYGSYAFYWQTLDVTFGPDITVFPGSFNVTLRPNTTRDYTLSIGNAGDADLSYTISDRITGGGSWQDIMTEDFEGAFPGSKWTVYASPGKTNAYWGKDGYNPHTGSYSAFCAKSGSAGVNPPANYRNNMKAWMIYGPFSLADASDAELNFWYWLDSEPNYDYLMWEASIDGSHFYGPRTSGNSGGWASESFDLTAVPTLGNLCGQAQVWIAFRFQSNGSNRYQGAFIDDVVLRQMAPEDCPWLDENPKSGSVAPGDSDDITVTIDTAGLAPGDYSAEIVIANNDPDEDPVAVPITLHVRVQAPTVITNAAANVEGTTATLNGTLSDDGGEPCQYRFEYDTDSGGPYAYNTSWTGSKSSGESFSQAVFSLNKGTKYYFRAQAKNSAGTASDPERSFLTKPDAPTGFNATAAGSTQIDLSWAKGDGAQKTKIQRKEGGYPSNRDDGTTVYFDTGTGTPDTGLSPGTTYYYRAWSYAQGSEQWSDDYDQASAATKEPDITLSPASFNVTLPPDTTQDYTLTISNDGDAALSYNISDGDCTWLSESLTSGSVAPGDSDDITVSIDSTGLGGNYTAEIVIWNNDPDKNPVAVPVALHVRWPVISYNITLAEDWNLISLPFIPLSSDIAELLEGISGDVAIVWGYDAGSETWLWYVPGEPSSTLTTIEDGLGYWIFMKNSATLNVSGREMPDPPAPPPAYDVFEGWNLIGYKSTIGMNHASYLANIAGNYPLIEGYDAEGQTWPYYSPGDPLSTLTTMEPGHGYWVWATADGTIVPPT